MSDMYGHDLPEVAPIVINEKGDTLVPNRDRPVIGGEADDIWVVAGKHAEDGGIMTLLLEGDHKILYCQRCRLHITFPSSVITYTDLRTHFAEFN